MSLCTKNTHDHSSFELNSLETGKCLWKSLELACYIFWRAVSTDETSYEAGIKVQIHSQDEPPFIDQLGFGVAPGFQTFVSCQQQLVPKRPASTLDLLCLIQCLFPETLAS